MTPLLRRVLLCLLVLALPAQGLAAATMALCGLVPAKTLSQVDGPTAAVPDCHGHDAQPAPADHACSACSVCALVGVLLDTAPELPVVSLGGPVVATPWVAAAAFVGDGLDRPPRPRG